MLLANSNATNWLDYLLQGGPFALVVGLFIFEKLITPGERDRLREENKQYKQDIAELNLIIREHIIPLLGQNNETMKKVYEEIAFMERLRNQEKGH